MSTKEIALLLVMGMLFLQLAIIFSDRKSDDPVLIVMSAVYVGLGIFTAGLMLSI